jgi:hypothetical protein
MTMKTLIPVPSKTEHYVKINGRYVTYPKSDFALDITVTRMQGGASHLDTKEEAIAAARKVKASPAIAKKDRVFVVSVTTEIEEV